MCVTYTGMDFYVVLERAGYRVARRRRCKNRVGVQHRVTKDEVMKWFQTEFEGVILNKVWFLCRENVLLCRGNEKGTRRGGGEERRGEKEICC